MTHVSLLLLAEAQIVHVGFVINFTDLISHGHLVHYLFFESEVIGEVRETD